MALLNSLLLLTDTPMIPIVGTTDCKVLNFYFLTCTVSFYDIRSDLHCRLLFLHGLNLNSTHHYNDINKEEYKID